MDWRSSGPNSEYGDPLTRPRHATPDYKCQADLRRCGFQSVETGIQAVSDHKKSYE